MNDGDECIGFWRVCKGCGGYIALLYVRTVIYKGMQNDHLGKLKRFHSKHRRMPSYGELASLLGFKSKNAAAYVVGKWLVDGVVRKDSAGKLIPGNAFRALRVLGTVPAGFPSAVEEDTGETVSLDEWLIGNREASYMLKVSGDSMIDAGIFPGDMVLLERGKTPKNGDVVVAQVDREWTIKHYEKRGGVVRLLPANKKYRPIEALDEMQLAGVVTAVIRKY